MRPAARQLFSTLAGNQPFRSSPLLTIHVVSHTHWDREWYHPAERFRQWLVPLVDELLDDAAAERSFLLDGQTVILEDYLEIRPERAAELAAALRSGRLEAGPWFVLADELIPTGEGLVRNLLAGRRTLRAMRAESPPVLYCPDSFGHPAALPTLARGFDKPLVILWRGFGGATAPRRSAVVWKGPDGEGVLLYHLSRSGYELGAALPSDAELAAARWRRIREELGARGGVGVELLLNGADHHARQRHLESALARARETGAPDQVLPSSITAFAVVLRDRVGTAKLPSVHGELRDSYGYTWTLQGTLGSRAPQKRRYAQREREMLRDVEPWLALLALDGGSSRRALANAAWRQLLLCQPHDTLCGCSIDAVSRAMDRRLEAVAAQAAGLRQDAILDLVGHDRDAARTRRDAWRSALLVRNRAPRPRSGVAIVELTAWVADVPVGPGSAPSARHDIAVPATPRIVGAALPQVLARTVEHERTEAPRAYPDNDEVLRITAAAWVEDIPAYGIRAFALGGARSGSVSKPRPVVVARDALSNGRLLLRVARDGAVAIEQDGRTVENLVTWESRTDVGDLYTPAIREERLMPRLLGIRVAHRGPLRGAIEQRWRLLGRDGRVDLRVRFILDAEASWLRIHVIGDNATRDHRLRIRIATDVEPAARIVEPASLPRQAPGELGVEAPGVAAFADAAFGVVHREPPHVPLESALVELPLPTAPLHRYVSLFNDAAGATLFADGLTEYEVDGRAIAVTLLRSVGELSRNDLPERPGNAGWPAATPEAQCLGPFEAELALMLHGARTEKTIDEIERAADDVLYPLVGETLRSALELPKPRVGLALEGAGLAFSCAKESDEGGWVVLRCLNLLDREVPGGWRLDRLVREARLARLDETPEGQVSVLENQIRFVAPPRAVVTILAR